MMEVLKWIILAPVFGAIINGLFLRSKNAYLVGSVGTVASLTSLVFSVIAIQGLQASGASSILEQWFLWFSVGRIHVPFNLELNSISSIMLLVVTGIGSLIHLYSISYISHDQSPWRFFAYLNLFLAAMLVLVLSSNLMGVFLGWEGVGLCSYLLIGYWYKDPKNTAAGMKAFLVNRIGDLGFFIALLVLITRVGSAEISDIMASDFSSWEYGTLLAVVFGLFWASTGKSAQIPLFVWLPDAMAGPTPVSALIHAATMVTSGVFVATRLWPLYAQVPALLEIIFWVGMATAWLGALIAISQNDIKKVLAYSTVSQLGFMFVALGAGSPEAALFHVLTHACFKALLFLGAGSVIHGMHECQDMQKMGGLKSKMKWTHLSFLVGTLAIIGFPFTAGFFSKDFILAQVYLSHGWLGYSFLLAAAVLTAFYMFRCYTLTFLGKPRSSEAEKSHESSPVMYVPLLLLGGASITVGFLETPDVIFGIHQVKEMVRQPFSELHQGLFQGQILSHSMEWVLMLITTGASLGAAYLAIKRFSLEGKAQWKENAFLKMSNSKFYVDEIYSFMIVKPLESSSRLLTKIIDEMAINGFLHGVVDGTKTFGGVLSIFHTGNLQTYAWYIVACVGAAIGVALLWAI